MAQSFDIVFIGGGPGGYTGAIRAGQLGFSVACIEKRATLGGTCLNVGCIPSKALLHSSELYEEASHAFPGFGIKMSGLSFDLPAMMANKSKIVEQNTKGVEFLFKKNKVTHIAGTATITGPGTIQVKLNAGGTDTINAKNIIISTGSEVTPLPGVRIDEERVVSSTGALTLKQVPKRLLVVGGGIIGLELGSVWRRLGAQVTVVEFLDHIAGNVDVEIGKQFQRVLQRQGMAFQLGKKVAKIDGDKSGLKVTIEPASGGASEVLEADIVLVSIGRRPYTEGLGLDKVGVALDRARRVVTDRFYRTNIGGIFAVGDVREGPMLAHKADDEGIAVVELIAGKAGHVNYNAIPSVVYTAPELASVGFTEEELKAKGVAYKVGKFPFTANARARIVGQPEGLVKFLADAKTDEIYGVHMLGPDVGTMIAEAALAIEFRAAAEDIARTSHPHPTLSEAVRQAAMGVGGWTIQA
jgi:dihydrolipoamide dehydrogenase